jgi:acetamidase/formamidase
VRHHRLKATPETVKLGAINRTDPPVLTIESGDEVSIETWSGWGNSIDEKCTLDDVLRLAATLGERGPHDLTGPIAVSGARQGQVLRVEILELKPAPHATNLVVPGVVGVGLLPDRFPEGTLRHYTLELDTMRVELFPGVSAPLAPFLGFMSVAPPDDGPHNSIPPGRHGGNIDLKDLVEGATLYLPIWNDDALFYAGDGHALQGNGEVDVTALEVTMKEARLRLTVLDRAPLELPRAETATSWITLGFGATLDEAARQATEAMIALIVELTGLTELDAYTLCSLCVDLEVTQAVNQTVGVHGRLSKSLLAASGHRGIVDADGSAPR